LLFFVLPLSGFWVFSLLDLVMSFLNINDASWGEGN
jgi:hypothetical protein